MLLAHCINYVCINGRTLHIMLRLHLSLVKSHEAKIAIRKDTSVMSMLIYVYSRGKKNREGHLVGRKKAGHSII